MTDFLEIAAFKLGRVCRKIVDVFKRQKRVLPDDEEYGKIRREYSRTLDPDLIMKLLPRSTRIGAPRLKGRRLELVQKQCRRHGDKPSS